MGKLAMPGAVKAAQLSEVVSNGAKILKETFDNVAAARRIFYSVRDEFEFLEGGFGKFGDIRFSRK